MTTKLFCLVVLLVNLCAAQDPAFGGIRNGLRYTFTNMANGGANGCGVGFNPPGLPVQGQVAGTYQLCFFEFDNIYLYSTDCGGKIFDRYAWDGDNSTLNGGIATPVNGRRYISDGSYQARNYNWGVGQAGLNTGYQYYSVVLAADKSRLLSFSYYSTGACYYNWVLGDGGVYKPWNAPILSFHPFRTTSFTGFTGLCNNNVNGNVNGGMGGVCLSCANNYAWVNMPTVVCLDIDRYNSYRVNDCIGNDLTNLWWTYGGYPNINGGVNNGGVNGGVNVASPYFPYTVQAGSYQLGESWGAATYSGFYLTGTNANCTWRIPLVHATDSTPNPSVVPVPGVYRLNSNIPSSTYNTYHWTNWGNNNAVWGTNCLNAAKTVHNGQPARVPEMCLLQESSNVWILTDCTPARTYMSFSWNGVSFTGWEGSHPIEVSFDTNGLLRSYSAIHLSGQCKYTHTVYRVESTKQPDDITNGLYTQVYTPSWDYARGNRYYYSFAGFNDACTNDLQKDEDMCLYNIDGSIVTSDCNGGSHSKYEWTGIYWEQVPWGTKKRSYRWIDVESITPTSFTSYYVRGGCEWTVTNTLKSTIAGPQAIGKQGLGHYTEADSSSEEGACIPDNYSDVGIYPSGLPTEKWTVRDWATGEALAKLRWDGSRFAGFDMDGMYVVAIHEDTKFTGLTGYVDNCIWTITFNFAIDIPVLPPIRTIHADHWFDNAHGVWNAHSDGGSCQSDDNDVASRYNTLLCLWPNGPAVLNVIQCNDARDDFQYILQQVYWHGGAQQWVGVDNKFSFTWTYMWDENKQNIIDEDTFYMTGTGDNDCSFSVTIWRGDDCETIGFVIGISLLSVTCFLLVLVILFLMSRGGSDSGYHEFQG